MGIVSTGNISTVRASHWWFHRWSWVERDLYSWSDPGSLPRGGVFELNFGGWVLAPFIFVISQNSWSPFLGCCGRQCRRHVPWSGWSGKDTSVPCRTYSCRSVASPGQVAKQGQARGEGLSSGKDFGPLWSAGGWGSCEGCLGMGFHGLPEQWRDPRACDQTSPFLSREIEAQRGEGNCPRSHGN